MADDSKCGKCEEEVTSATPAVGCERCEKWFHHDCVGLKATSNSRILAHQQILFLCMVCLPLTLDEWKNKDKKKESEERPEKSVRTIETQTEVPKMVKRKAPIRIVGDSMVRRTPDVLKCNMPGSGCTSLSGAHIKDVKDRVVEEAASMEKESLLIIQGGGNNLLQTGCENTVKDVVDSVKAVEEKKMSVAVIGVLRRPKEGPEYERLRKETNRKIHEEIIKMKVQWLKEGKGNISFLDMDPVLGQDKFFARDGVHLNEEGQSRMGRRLREWVNARSLRWVTGG